MKDNTKNSDLSKKGIKKTSKPCLVFIYGFMAVGKLTVAKELSKLTGYNILHNHMILDLVSNLLGSERPGSIEKSEIRQWLHFELTGKLMGTGQGFIFTHAYSSSFVFRNGMSDLDFVKNIEKIVNESGGIFCPVYLSCDEKEMLIRTKHESRKSHKKLRSVKIMKNLLKIEDSKKPAPLKNNFEINTTKISPKKSAKMIKEHFKLK